MTVAGLQVMFFDEVRDDFRVGLGGEFVAFGDQLLLEREIVFDNSVVHDHDLAGAVAMGMGIFFGGAAVRGPARVSNAIGAVKRLEADHFFEIAQFAFGAANLKACAIAGKPRFRLSRNHDTRAFAGPPDDGDDSASYLHIPRCRTLDNLLLDDLSAGGNRRWFGSP